ncbi:phosphatidyl serine synthase-domain-containing protein [Cantharellus anzutake]|uniref:phosphatidyl serine synthase-domain-containing protein n=1 Tax=Cantharellus anzutake TaxID=1750568 RepID=UPI001906D523|nr:phosphatidyl serine synthase-domain-containing protein [Cantharellus anzutake]KAF8329460.1 phosphatidyl serine synthase-domain-containing protein [Cantharellus anzutake]
MTPGPQPGLNGVPVRWYDADRSEPYTRIVPFDRTNDTSVGFFFKPATLTALAIMLAILAYVAISKDVLEEGRDKQLLGIYSTIVAFLTFSLVQFRDGPFLRPHPAFWRVVLGVNLIYELGLVFLLFQDLDSARMMMKYLDPSLGVPLPEKSYTEDCTLTLKTLWGAIDIFCLAHSLGWFGKALILRDYWFCWILSVAFELAEYSLSHQLPNFNECWWDHWLLDVLICNWAGISLGMRTCAYFEVKRYVWRGFRETRGIRKKSARVVKQLTPQSWTTFKWEGTRSFVGYVAVVSLLTTFLVAELNVFYLKALLWMGPEHKFVIARLAGMFLCALPATRELYQYLHETQRVVRMGQHAWLLLATVLTELLIIVKFGRGQFPEPFPTPVKVFFASLVFFLIAYPSIKFGIPAVRRTAKQSIQPLQTKAKDHDAKND